MFGNKHVRFLGECGRVIVQSYPTRPQKSTKMFKKQQETLNKHP